MLRFTERRDPAVSIDPCPSAGPVRDLVSRPLPARPPASPLSRPRSRSSRRASGFFHRDASHDRRWRSRWQLAPLHTHWRSCPPATATPIAAFTPGLASQRTGPQVVATRGARRRLDGTVPRPRLSRERWPAPRRHPSRRRPPRLAPVEVGGGEEGSRAGRSDGDGDGAAIGTSGLCDPPKAVTPPTWRDNLRAISRCPASSAVRRTPSRPAAAAPRQ